MKNSNILIQIIALAALALIGLMLLLALFYV
jgi:hypothetical protein